VRLDSPFIHEKALLLHAALESPAHDLVEAAGQRDRMQGGSAHTSAWQGMAA
jgi:hypothetical protein